MKLTKIIYDITMSRSRNAISQRYGDTFWRDFKEKSGKHLNYILPKVPYIGDSVFAFNYEFGPAYIAWYKTFMELGLSSSDACKEIWAMNERLVTLIPRWLMPLSIGLYIGGFRKKAMKHAQKSRDNAIYPYDWKISYRSISDNTFEIDITECAMIKLGRDFDALGMFPCICRMDYLFSHYMGNGFERTKTLGDGDECCNCRYHMKGDCEWSPEKGFADRK